MRILSALSFTLFLSSFTLQCTNHVPTNEELFKDKRILVIGGTGYLGQAIVEAVLTYDPEAVIIFSRDEVKHSLIKRRFNCDPRVYSMVGDIRDYNALIHATKDVDVVFHAAALKRVEILEENPLEAIKTNVLGTLNVFNACIENDVAKVVFISTDKACQPVNAYGGSKFLGEKIFTNGLTDGTVFVSTRFGNIIESTGSVVPFFINKIIKGEDIPLTDERMTRFFITKEEATEHMFNALRYGVGGEIFVKQLPAFKLTDLIDFLKDRYHAKNNVQIIGLRPGEKIHEVMINEAEIDRTYEFNNCYVICSSIGSIDPENPPAYVQRGKLMNHTQMDHYSSDQAVINLEELTQWFDNSPYA